MQTNPIVLDEITESRDSQASGRIVANVAQELKSPLAAMTEGHKHIMSILKDVRSRLSNIPEVPEKLLLDLEDAECTLDSTSNLSHFMKMSINRCIEYSHVREHHPLSPNLVSVKLADALNLPVACVTSIDPAHVLEVKPFPSDLCTHVMADVQWLQENILLLLSNAVKYSNPGHTTLSLSLRTSTSLKEEFTITPVPKDLISHTLHSNVKFSGDDCVLLHVEVEDTGLGLTTERLAQLFSPEQMQQRITAGTGLGLLSLFKRMEALNGHCGVRARRDGRQGCLFWFAFPYIPDELTAEMQHKEKPHKENTQNAQDCVGIAQEQHTTPHSLEAPDQPDHDVLNSTLKNVLPSPMLFEPSDKHDTFNAFAVFPTYAKKSNSRSLRSAMNNLPTTVQKGGHITIAPGENKTTTGSSNLTSISEKLNSSSLNSDSGNSISNTNNDPSLVTDVHTPVSRWENITSATNDTNSLANRLSTSTNSTDHAFSRSNSGAKRASGRTLMLNLPSETNSRPTSISTSIRSNNVDNSTGIAESSGKVLSTHDSFGSVRTRTDTDVTIVTDQNMVAAIEPSTNTNTTSLNETNHASTSDSTHQDPNNNTNRNNTNFNNNSSTCMNSTTPRPNTAPILTHANLQNNTPPQLRTMEPSPASSTGTPHRPTVDYGWKPDSLSMIRTYIYNILLVEDTPMVLKMTSLILTREGFHVTTAENGLQALELMQQKRFDVVLMDLQMPVLNGLEAARRIRQRERENAEEPLFLIAVSANSDKMIVLETLSAGFDNYIEKPFTVEQFQSVTSKYLMKKHLK